MHNFDKFFEKNSDFFYGFEEPDNITKWALKYKKSGAALDLGCGAGRNSIFLAGKGFDVTAIDVSELGIEKFKKTANEMKLKIKILLDDVGNFVFKKKYDIILCRNVLQFLEKDKAKHIVKEIQRNTKKGGLNLISAFAENNLYSRRFSFLLKKNELKKIYKNWEILFYREILGPVQKHGDGPEHQHLTASIIAKKI